MKKPNTFRSTTRTPSRIVHSARFAKHPCNTGCGVRFTSCGIAIAGTANSLSNWRRLALDGRWNQEGEESRQTGRQGAALSEPSDWMTSSPGIQPATSAFECRMDET